MGVKLGRTFVHRASKAFPCRKKDSCLLGRIITAGEPYIKSERWTRQGKRYFRNVHLVCFASWANFLLEYREEHVFTGRPKGSGQLALLDGEAKQKRRALVRARAYIIRKFQVELDDNASRALWVRKLELEELIDATGIPIMRGLSQHRSQADAKAIMEKAERIRIPL